jgi:ORF6N domain
MGFMFQLTEDEWGALRSQLATLKAGRGEHREYLPYAFTEHGAIMAATILNSPRATDILVYVVRAFVELRALLAGNKELALKLAELESRIAAKTVEVVLIRPVSAKCGHRRIFPIAGAQCGRCGLFLPDRWHGRPTTYRRIVALGVWHASFTLARTLPL